MLSDASLYSQYHNMQVRDTRHLLDTIMPHMQCMALEGDVVMDIGCGPGNTTRDMLLPAFPSVKAVVAIDVLDKMVDFAKKESGHPKISYHVANIEDRSTLQQWEGAITKAVSIYCFNWVKNHQVAFTNLFNLLTAGGEAVILFASSSLFWDSFKDRVENPKWNVYLKDVEQHIPECHAIKGRSQYYRRMLEAIGFTVRTCDDEPRTFAYQNDAECKVACSSRCALTKHIPEDFVEEFKEELFRGFVQHNGRSDDGRPELKYTALTLLIQKPDVEKHIPECHGMKDRSGYYRRMLEAIGFTVRTCDDEQRTFAHQNDAECEVACFSRCALSKHIPEDFVEEFEEELFRGFVQHNGRSDDGRPEIKYTALTLLLQKPVA